MTATHSSSVDLLILGAGWTSQFLEPLLDAHKISFAATSTNGRDGTIPFRFDPDSDDTAPYERLPAARTVVITFPLRGTGQSKHLTKLYARTHPKGDTDSASTQWIQLGSSGIYTGDGWRSSTSPYDTANVRAIAEDELMADAAGCILNLSGLYDGVVRDPRNYLARVARSKEQLAAKGAVHFIHGVDVARAVVAVHQHFTPGKRWLVADLHVYDWWDLAMGWGAEARRRLRAQGEDETVVEALRYEEWVGELMEEKGIRALPREVESLGRVLDSRDFWKEMGLWPSKALTREPQSA